MTAQGRHRPQDKSKLVHFAYPDHWIVISRAVYNLERKGYEVRAMRLHVEDHGKKATVVLHLSPAPKVGKYPEHVGYGWNGKYKGQNVGTTRRRNVETLLAYVEGLPDVRCNVPGGVADMPPAV